MADSRPPTFEEVLRWARDPEERAVKQDRMILYWTGGIMLLFVVLWLSAVKLAQVRADLEAPAVEGYAAAAPAAVPAPGTETTPVAMAAPAL